MAVTRVGGSVGIPSKNEVMELLQVASKYVGVGVVVGVSVIAGAGFCAEA
jgi:ribosomal protein L30/L7E